MGGRLIDDGQYDYHVWFYYTWLTFQIDKASYERLRA